MGLFDKLKKTVSSNVNDLLGDSLSELRDITKSVTDEFKELKSDIFDDAEDPLQDDEYNDDFFKNLFDGDGIEEMKKSISEYTEQIKSGFEAFKDIKSTMQSQNSEIMSEVKGMFASMGGAASLLKGFKPDTASVNKVTTSSTSTDQRSKSFVTKMLGTRDCDYSVDSDGDIKAEYTRANGKPVDWFVWYLIKDSKISLQTGCQIRISDLPDDAITTINTTLSSINISAEDYNGKLRLYSSINTEGKSEDEIVKDWNLKHEAFEMMWNNLSEFIPAKKQEPVYADEEEEEEDNEPVVSRTKTSSAKPSQSSQSNSSSTSSFFSWNNSSSTPTKASTKKSTSVPKKSSPSTEQNNIKKKALENAKGRVDYCRTSYQRAKERLASERSKPSWKQWARNEGYPGKPGRYTNVETAVFRAKDELDRAVKRYNDLKAQKHWSKLDLF